MCAPSMIELVLGAVSVAARVGFRVEAQLKSTRIRVHFPQSTLSSEALAPVGQVRSTLLTASGCDGGLKYVAVLR